MKTLAFSHSHAIKNQPDSLSLFVLGGRGGDTLCKLIICCGEWEQFVLRKQAKRFWQMQLFELKCLTAKRLQFVEPKQASLGTVCQRAVCLAQTNRFWARPLFCQRKRNAIC